MPSKLRPSARRSQVWRPHFSAWTSDAARWRTSGDGSSSRQPKIRACSRSATERWSATENWVSLSTSSPQRSIRSGESAVEGKTSTIEPRTANSPRCSTWYSRRYPNATSFATSSSRSTWAPRVTCTGSLSSTCGPKRWRSALTVETMTEGTPEPLTPSRSRRSRHMSSRRRPIVSTAGLTRSKGRVSQAGKTATSPGPTQAAISWASRSAVAPFATATTTGRRAPCSATAATAKPCAASATATEPSAPIVNEARTPSRLASESSPARAGPGPEGALVCC